MTKSILIVEDDDELARLEAEVVEAGGYVAVVARNGLEALEHLRKRTHPDLILLDMSMPVMDGWEFRREQQKLPRIAAIPVVVLTADGDPRLKSASIGAQGHLEKPVGIEALLGEVERLCGAPD